MSEQNYSGACETRAVMWRLGTALSLILTGSSVASSETIGGETTAASEEGPAFYAAEPVLREYVVEAIDANPSVQEALAGYRAALERVPQVEALPDPMLSYTQAIRSVETRVGPQRNTFMLSQAFPWFGKLSLRGKVALQKAAAHREMYRARQRQVIADVKKTYYSMAYFDAALRITEEEHAVLDHYERLAQTRYATGGGLQQAVIKIQAEITKVINRLDILRQQRESLSARLNTLLDREPEGPIARVSRLALPEVEIDLGELYALGTANRQELKAAEQLIEGRERAIELAGKDSWPSLRISAGFVNVGERNDPAGIAQPPPDNGKNAFNVSLGLSLPLWRGKYSAGVREASERMLAEQKRYAQLRNTMELSIRDETLRFETLREQIELFERALIPQAEEALRSTESGYATGQLGVLDLLDSERVLLGVRLTHAQYQTDLMSALARLERAVGTRFPR